MRILIDLSLATESGKQRQAVPRSTICFLGSARYTYPLNETDERKFRALASLGELLVVAFSADAIPRQFKQHAQFYLLPDLPLPFVRYILMLVLGPVLALFCIFRHGAGILVAQSPYEGFIAAWAKLLARFAGRRVALIVESHGDFEEAVFLQRHVLWPQAYRSLMRRLAAFAFAHADALRAVSSATRRQMEAWSPGKPIIQFPAWTNFELFLRDTHERAGVGPPIVVFAGMVTPLKGVHVLLEAFAAISPGVSNAQLHIAGATRDVQYRSRLAAQAERLGVERRIRFLGHLEQRDLALEMARASVLVLPSLSEALGRVLFEAMASGTPVVGSRVGGIPDLIVDGQTGFLVPPGDVAMLADRLRWILTHPDEAHRIGQRAQSQARSIFSTESYIRGYAELLQLVSFT